MKKILLAVILVLTFIGCGKEDSPEIQTSVSLLASTATNENEEISITESLKSQHHFRILKKNFSTNVTTEYEIEMIPDIEVDLGYGQKEIGEYKPRNIYFLNEGYAIRYDAGISSIPNTTLYHIQTYDKEFRPLKSRASSISAFQARIIYGHYPWYNNTILEIEDGKKRGNSSINVNILNSNLQIVETLNDVDFTLTSVYIPLDSYSFVCHENKTIYRSNFYGNIAWRVIIADAIKDSESSNQPIIDFMKITKNGNFVYAYYTVTFYSGKKQTAVLKINSNNGEYELSYP